MLHFHPSSVRSEYKMPLNRQVELVNRFLIGLVTGELLI